MKKLFLFAMFSIFLMSCGGAGQQPTDNITWGQAFNHVSHSLSYWLFIIIAAGVAVYGGWKIYKAYDAKDIDGGLFVMYAFLILALNLTVWLVRPSEVAANTTVEQMLRGVYIGY